MQLGMVGLGRMGANIVRRLMDAGHECVVYDVNEAPIAQLEAEGALGARSLEEFASKLTAPRVAWIMVPAAFAGATVNDVAEQLERGDIIIDGGNSYYRDDLDRAAECAQRGIHFVDIGTSGGVFGRERGYCLMIGGEEPIVVHLDPLFRTLAPGVEAASRTPGRSGPATAAEHGYLHCGGHGAGHFVKMVHNGIEYGIMGAIAEGLAILKKADVGLQRARPGRRDGAAAESRALPVPLRHARDRRGLAARQRDRLVAARPDGRRPARGSHGRGLLGARLRLGRGALDGARRGRGGGARAHPHDGAVRALQLARRGRLRRQAAVGDAAAVRRAPGEARRVTVDHRRAGPYNPPSLSAQTENIAAVRSSYEAFSRGDLDGALAMMDDGIVWHQAQGLAHGGVYHGLPAVRAAVFDPIDEQWWEDFDAVALRAARR